MWAFVYRKDSRGSFVSVLLTTIYPLYCRPNLSLVCMSSLYHASRVLITGCTKKKGDSTRYFCMDLIMGIYIFYEKLILEK